MKRRCVTLLFGLVIVVLTGYAAAQVEELFSPHYEALLAEYLIEQHLDDGGLVSAFDYQAALADPDTPGRLTQQRARLSEFDTSALETREQATAFWVNAYNFFMLAQILEDRPDGALVDSVWDFGGRYNPFRANVFQLERFNVGGTMMSLDGIEKGMLLGEAFRQRGWADARIHFAVNCAAVGCPPLRGTLYTAGNVDTLLTENTRLAFNTPYQLRVDGDTLYVSSLFDWYEADFLAEASSIRAFIADYAGPDVVAQIRATSDTRFIDYDWRLNRPASFPEIP